VKEAPTTMNHRMDTGHVNKGFSANEEFCGSVHFDTQHYDEIDLGVKEVTFQAAPLSKYHVIKAYRGRRR
jgi:hypothetical protein